MKFWQGLSSIYFLEPSTEVALLYFGKLYAAADQRTARSGNLATLQIKETHNYVYPNVADCSADTLVVVKYQICREKTN